MSSAEKDSTTPDGGAPRSELSPMDGGPWRPVKPEELLRRDGMAGQDNTLESTTAPEVPKVRLERRQQLEHHLKESPTDLNGYLELGRIYREENRPADARRILQQATEIVPDEDELKWELEEAILARSLQQLREVSELAERLDTVETERELERCQADWAARRMEVCHARLRRDPSKKHLRVSLAEALYDAGEFRDALEAIDEVIQDDEFSPIAYLLRGRCLLELGKDVEAMASLRASALRRAVVAPLPIRVMALRLLCDVAERMGVPLTLAKYRQHLQQSEQELAKAQAGTAK